MDREEAKKQAEARVLFNMNRGDIEEACRQRGFRVVKSRSAMEIRLVKAITEELLKGQEA